MACPGDVETASTTSGASFIASARRMAERCRSPSGTPSGVQPAGRFAPRLAIQLPEPAESVPVPHHQKPRALGIARAGRLGRRIHQRLEVFIADGIGLEPADGPLGKHGLTKAHVELRRRLELYHSHCWSPSIGRADCTAAPSPQPSPRGRGGRRREKTRPSVYETPTSTPRQLARPVEHREGGAARPGMRNRKPASTRRSMLSALGWGWPQGTLCSLQISRIRLMWSATTGWS